MLARLYPVLSAALLLQVLCFGAAQAKMMSKADMRAKQAAAMERFSIQTNARASGTGVKNITFSNPRAAGASRCFGTSRYSSPERSTQSSTSMARRSPRSTLTSVPAGPASCPSVAPPTRHARQVVSETPSSAER